MTHRLISRALLLSTLLGIGGCAVGPDFVAPQAQLPAQWREPAATPAPSAPVPESLNTSWWASFGDPTLTALINEATAANVDIRIAYEHLRQSRAALGITEADTLPRVGAGASYQRGQNSEAGLADPSGARRPLVLQSLANGRGRQLGTGPVGPSPARKSNSRAHSRKRRWKRNAP